MIETLRFDKFGDADFKFDNSFFYVQVQKHPN